MNPPVAFTEYDLKFDDFIPATFFKNCLELACRVYDIPIANAYFEIEKKLNILNTDENEYIRKLVSRFSVLVREDYVCQLDLLVFSCCYNINFKFTKLSMLNSNFQKCYIPRNDIENFNYQNLSLILTGITGQEVNSYDEVRKRLGSIYEDLLYVADKTPKNFIREAPIIYKAIEPSKEKKAKSEEYILNNENGEKILCKSNDLDAIYGIIPIDNIFNGIKTNFVLDFSSKNSKQETNIYCKKNNFIYQNEVKNVRDCFIVPLGKFVISLGSVKAYLCYPKRVIDDVKKFEKVFRAIRKYKDYDTEPGGREDLKRVTCANQLVFDMADGKITGTIPEEYLENFFTFINKELRPHDIFFYFIELFGNKNFTRTASPQLLLSKICENLNLENLKYINIDLCTEYHLNGPYVLALTEERMGELGFAENFTILFSGIINNCNKSLISMTTTAEGKKYTYSKGCCDKINFYSSLEDITKPAMNASFLPKIGLEYFKMTLFSNHSPYISTINKKIRDLEKMVAELENQAIGYRKEVSVKACFFVDALAMIDSGTMDDFYAVPTSKINQIIKTVTETYISHIKAVDIKKDESILKLQLLELCFDIYFLKGQRNWHQTPEIFKNSIRKYFDSDITYLDITVDKMEFDLILPTPLGKKHVQRYFWKHYSYRRDCENDWEQIFTIASVENGLDMILFQLINDYNKRLSLKIKTFDGECKNNPAFLNGETFIDDVVNNFFYNTKKYLVKMNFRIMFNILNRLFTLTKEDIVEALKRNNIEYIYNFNTPNPPSIVKILYNCKPKATLENPLFLKSRKFILDELRNYPKKPTYYAPDDERAKNIWLMALTKVTSVPWAYYNQSCLFVTLGTRSCNSVKECCKNLKDKNKSKAHENEIQALIKKAMNFNPFEKSYRNLILEFNKFFLTPIKETPEFIKAFKFVYFAEKENLKANLFHINFSESEIPGFQPIEFLDAMNIYFNTTVKLEELYLSWDFTDKEDSNPDPLVNEELLSDNESSQSDINQSDDDDSKILYHDDIANLQLSPSENKEDPDQLYVYNDDDYQDLGFLSDDREDYIIKQEKSNSEDKSIEINKTKSSEISKDDETPDDAEEKELADLTISEIEFLGYKTKNEKLTFENIHFVRNNFINGNRQSSSGDVFSDDELCFNVQQTLLNNDYSKGVRHQNFEEEVSSDIEIIVKNKIVIEDPTKNIPEYSDKENLKSKKKFKKAVKWFLSQIRSLKRPNFVTQIVKNKQSIIMTWFKKDKHHIKKFLERIKKFYLNKPVNITAARLRSAVTNGNNRPSIEQWDKIIEDLLYIGFIKCQKFGKKKYYFLSSK